MVSSSFASLLLLILSHHFDQVSSCSDTIGTKWHELKGPRDRVAVWQIAQSEEEFNKCLRKFPSSSNEYPQVNFATCEDVVKLKDCLNNACQDSTANIYLDNIISAFVQKEVNGSCVNGAIDLSSFQFAVKNAMKPVLNALHSMSFLEILNLLANTYILFIPIVKLFIFAGIKLAQKFKLRTPLTLRVSESNSAIQSSAPQLENETERVQVQTKAANEVQPFIINTHTDQTVIQMEREK